MNNKQQAIAKLSRDEMNLAEFPLTVIGKRVPKGVKTLHFEDEIEDSNTGETIHRQLTVTGSDLLGLPTSVDDEVLVGCLKLSANDRFRNRRVQFTPYEFLEEIGWGRDSKSYRRLTESLDRWAALTVFSNNAYWHKGKQRFVKDTFGIIDRWKSVGNDRSDPKQVKNAWLLWGDFVWESVSSGNLKKLDFEFWKELNSPVSKRLFRFLDKKFYQRREVRYPLKRLAHDKVGISRKLHTGQVKQALEKGHVELHEKGFCRSAFEKQGRGEWVVVYTDLRNSSEKPERVSHSDPLVEALKERGIKNASELFEKQPSRERIEQAIENYDDRKAHGEKITHRWLASNILHKVGYDFRPGFVPKAEKLKQEQERAAKEEANKKRLAALEEKRLQAKRAEDHELQAFLESLGSEAELERFIKAAVNADSYLREQFERTLKTNPKQAEIYKQIAIRNHWLQVRKKASD